jgi:hypothetical protein
MIIVPPDDIVWESTDAASLTLFLASNTGQRFLGLLAYQTPEFEDGSNGNKTLVAMGKVEGYQTALKNLVRAQTHHPKDSEVPTAYPSLDDESAWEKDSVDAKGKQ